MDNPLHRIARAELDGVPVFWAPQLPGLPYSAGLVVRTGRCDESVRTSGITHLVEHLALPPGARPPVDFNGMVDNTTTSFWFVGPPDRTAALLQETIDALDELPLQRLERELGILRTESESSSSGGMLQHALWLRFGSVGHGLGWHDELGLWWLGAGEVTSWARERFSSGNVAVYFTGEVPSELRIPLAPGARFAAPEPELIGALEFPCVFPDGPPGGVWMSFVGDRSVALSTGISILENRVREQLRARAGVTYAAESVRESLSGKETLVLVRADCRDEHTDVVRGTLLAILDDFVERGPTGQELADTVTQRELAAGDASLLAGALHYRAEQELWGEPFETESDFMEQHRALVPEDVRVAFARAVPSLMLAIPEGATIPKGRFHAYPLDSKPIEGKRFKRRGLSIRREGTERELVVGDEGVTLHGEDYVRSIPFDECVAAVRWEADADGRTLWAKDGTSIYIDPAIWRGGSDALAAIDRGTTHAALDLTSQIPFANPDLEAGAAAYDRGDWDDAVRHLERGLDGRDENAREWAVLSFALDMLGRAGDALVAAERACAIDPSLAMAHSARARALTTMGRADDAAAAARSALDLAPADLDVLATCAWLLAVVGEEDAAQRAATRALELFPEEASSWFASGWVAQSFGRWVEAESALTRAAELDPTESMWPNNVGWVLLCTKRPAEALRRLEEALKLDPENRYAVYNRAYALAQLGRRQEAEAVLDARLELDLRASSEAIVANPDDSAAERERILCLKELRRLDEAFVEAQRAVERHGDDPETLRLMVDVLCDTDDFVTARDVLSRVLDVDGDSLSTLWRRAALAVHLGDAADAEAAAARAREINERDGRSLRASGYGAAAAGDWERSAACFEEFLQRAPLHCCSLAAHGLALLELGDEAGARRQLAAADVASVGMRCQPARRLRQRLA